MGRTSIISNAVAAAFFFVWVPCSFGQTIPENPVKGGQLFASKGCAHCHPLRGEQGKIGPDLSRKDLGDTRLNLAARIWNHTPSMMAEMESMGITKPTLTGEDFADISAYLYFLGFLDEPGNSTQGRYVYAEKGCHFCHPPAGRGTGGASGLDRFPQNISPTFLSRAIWDHCLDMIVRMVEIGLKWPTFRGREMADLLQYIRTHAKGPEEPAFASPGDPKQGKQIFFSKGCTQCHSIRGEGAKSGIDLTRTASEYYTSLTGIASIMWNKGPAVLVRIAQTQCGIPRFTSQEMADLLSYLYFLRFVDEPGNKARGERLFSEIGCGQCHGPDRNSGKLMFINLSKYEAASEMEIVAGMWNHSTQIQKAVGEQNMTWPRFREGEMADLLEFVRTPRQK
jgi:mono/diheme cytochrome c family protein